MCIRDRFQNDEEFDPSDDETDLEEAYEGFFAEEGPDGEGETSLDGEDGGLSLIHISMCIRDRASPARFPKTIWKRC